jgi:hypothetical protein
MWTNALPQDGFPGELGIRLAQEESPSMDLHTLQGSGE